MELVNLTPHAIHIVFDMDGEKRNITLPPSGEVARISSSEEETSKVLTRDEQGTHLIPCFGVALGAPEGVPESRSGVGFIVSGMVLDHPDLKNREDLFAPGPLLRDEVGRVIGCRGLRVSAHQAALAAARRSEVRAAREAARTERKRSIAEIHERERGSFRSRFED